MSRIAVTGSAGFIGRAVVDRLRKHGISVAEIDRTGGYDILTDDLAWHLDGCDAVIHLAGVLGTTELFDQVELALHTNIYGTLRVLQAAQQTGTGYVGITMPDVFPSIYTATKIASQRLASAFHHAHGLAVVHVRAFNAFGPGQAHGPGHPRKLIPALSCEGWAGQPLTVWGDGEQTVDLIHVDELARVLVEATTVTDDSFIDAGCGLGWTVNHVAKTVVDLTGSKAGVVHRPMRRGEVATDICAAGDGWQHLTVRPLWSMSKLELTVDAYRGHELAQA